MLTTSSLIVRQHERAGIRVPVEFVIAPRHAEQVRFSTASSAIRHDTITGTAIDISPGGMGMECTHFLPRMCEGTIRVYGPTPSSASAPGAHSVTPAQQRTMLLEQRVQVRRVALIGRDPTYLIGMAFIMPPADIAARISAMLTSVGVAQTPRPAANAGPVGRSQPVGEASVQPKRTAPTAPAPTRKGGGAGHA